MTAALMEEFPPPADRLVTLASKAPFSAWGFRNVRRLIPTADVAASGHAMELETSLEEIGHIEFSSHDGKSTSVGRALRATRHRCFHRSQARADRDGVVWSRH